MIPARRLILDLPPIPRLAGLVLWLSASAIGGLADGDPVVTWPDSSGQGNDVTQATASKRPLYKTAIQNGRPYTIVGVMPPPFQGDEIGHPVDLWIPIAMQSQVMTERPGLLTNPSPPWLRIVATTWLVWGDGRCSLASWPRCSTRRLRGCCCNVGPACRAGAWGTEMSGSEYST